VADTSQNELVSKETMTGRRKVTTAPPMAEEKTTPGRRGRGVSDLCDRVVDLVLIGRSAAPRRGVAIPSGAGASGSNHLPWALPRVLQAIPKIKRTAGANRWRAGRGSDDACSKDVSTAFDRHVRGSAIAASRAGRRRGTGRGGKPRRATGPRRRAKRNGMDKAGVTGSAFGAENHQQTKPFQRPRG